jgi:hypothetical protein
MQTPKQPASGTATVAAAVDLNDEVLNRAEAAAVLDVNTRTLDDWHERGEGPPVCVLHGSRRYLKSSLLAWVKSAETASADARRVRPGNRGPRAKAQAAAPVLAA